MAQEKDLFNDPDFIRALIMDHYQYPHNHDLKNDEKTVPYNYSMTTLSKKSSNHSPELFT